LQKNIFISTENEEEKKSRGWDQIMPRTTVSINDVCHKINNKGDGTKMSSLTILTEVLFFLFSQIFASGHGFRPEFSRLPAKPAYPSYSISPSFME
jgi:hypothetical protein